jgi:hypothetical protein
VLDSFSLISVSLQETLFSCNNLPRHGLTG